MKTRILIIEDNYYRYFTAKQVIEAKTRVNVNVSTANESNQVREMAMDVKPDIILFKPKGGIMDLLDFLKNKNVNRRNAEISMLLVPMNCNEDSIDLRGVGRSKSRKARMATAA